MERMTNSPKAEECRGGRRSAAGGCGASARRSLVGGNLPGTPALIARPPGNGDLGVFHCHVEQLSVLVAPDRVLTDGQARVDSGVLRARCHVSRPDLRVSPWPVSLADRADLDFGAVEFGRRVQDQGPDAMA